MKDTSFKGMGIGDWMFIVLFTLKLGLGDTDVQHLSWWWVTAPLWISFAIIVVCAAILAVAKE
jgi:hypothetical protein